MGKRYQSVLDMVRDTADQQFAEDFEQRLADYSVSTQLLVLRNREGLTQAELAKRMGCPQNRISKIEHTPNDKIRLGDLHSYVAALDVDIMIQIGHKRRAVDRIKCAAFDIKHELDSLAQLAQKDTKIRKEISNFFAEYLFNMIRFFTNSAEQLQGAKSKRKNPFAVLGEVLSEVITAVQKSGKLLPETPAEEPEMLRVCAYEEEESPEEDPETTVVSG